MSRNIGVGRRRMVAALGMIGVALAFGANYFTGAIGGRTLQAEAEIARTGILSVAGMLAMACALAGVWELLRPRADIGGMIGAALALMGWTASTRIATVMQLDHMARAGREGVTADAIERILNSAPLVWASIFTPGLMFPIGLIVLGTLIAIKGVAPRAIGMLLAAGGVMFPLARIGALRWAFIGSDLAICIAFASLAWFTLRQRKEVTMEAGSRSPA